MRTVASTHRHFAFVLASLISVTACRLPSASPTSPGSASDGATDVHADALYCVAEINKYRTAAGLPAFEHMQALEDFGHEAARVDGEAHEFHKHFYATGGGGVSRAQNEIPWWSLSRYGSVREIVRQGIKMQWDEGPGGYHYETLFGSYKYVGCGIANVNGEITVTHDFR